jgi:hypothetical protein
MTTELVARATYAIARARHARHRQPSGSPIVVFSMAKTGSSAVAAGLRATGQGPVYHVHDLDPAFLEREEAQYRWSGRPWRIWDARRLLQRPPTATAPWRVVSIVRDPIAQTLSAFFQPGARHGYLHPGATVGSLQERFGDRLDHLPLRWFETHLQPALGIDVYDSSFDPGQGYQIISTATVRLLLLRCEDLAVAPVALARLLETEAPVAVPRVNVGADKAYAGLYESVRSALRPTTAQLDRAYGSRLVRHFYSREEIARLRRGWSDDVPPSLPSSPSTTVGEGVDR